MTSADVLLTICAEIETLTSYAFRCPACHQDVTTPANRHCVALLMSARVPSYVLRIPAEALEPHGGPPISGDDLIDLMLGLDEADPLRELMADG